MVGGTFLHYVRVLRDRELPQTQTSKAERDLLIKYLAGRKRIVEVGVFEGFTTRLFADYADADATIYGVDPFFRGRLGLSWGLRITSAYNRKHLRSGRVKLVRTCSIAVGNQVPEDVDFVFIDGDHSLEAVRDDWSFWSTRVMQGGVIGLHDTLLPLGAPKDAGFGSHQYFKSHIQQDPRFEIMDQQDSLSILRKL